MISTEKSITHFIYWLIAYLALVRIFSISGDLIQSTLFASLLIPVIMIASYTFVYRLVPVFLFRQRHLLFGITSITLLFLVIYVELLIVTLFLISFGDYQIFNLNPQIHDIYVMISAPFMVAFPAVIIETLRHLHVQKLHTETESDSSHNTKQITVRSEGKNVILKLNSIYFAESFGDLIKIHTAANTITTRKSLSALGSQLPDFIRIHRSFLINPANITSYTHESLTIKERELPVGRTYKDEVISKLTDN